MNHLANKKCIICGEAITDNEFVPYKNRYAHTKCFNIAVKTLHENKTEKLNERKKTTGKTKKITPIHDCLSEEESKYKNNYYDYIREITGQAQLSPKVYALTDNYIKRYGFTYEDMYLTLFYLKEIMGRDLEGDGVGLIPYYYNEAQGFFVSVKHITQANDLTDINKLYKTKTVCLPKYRERKVKQIDITKI